VGKKEKKTVRDKGTSSGSNECCSLKVGKKRNLRYERGEWWKGKVPTFVTRVVV